MLWFFVMILLSVYVMIYLKILLIQDLMMWYFIIKCLRNSSSDILIKYDFWCRNIFGKKYRVILIDGVFFVVIIGQINFFR